eukprot:TRINITY_DN9837_c0_g1_i1.p1 TRINITY_DN9837_c0_g1~~TRINITY_DN9837_c0_g1_i1.p1  ORF type:complete len:390 (+),score=62.83 TRINITY_DN9837_c0_g1_i1:232-1401(+)
MEVDVDKYDSKDLWREVIPHRYSVKLGPIDSFEDFLVIWEREQGLKRVQIRNNLYQDSDHFISFEEPVFTIYPGANYEYHTDQYRFYYTSLTTPKSVFDYDINSRTRRLIKQDEVLGGFDSNNYQSERLFAPNDKISVPISLVYKKGLKKNGSNPTLLYGYGAYGITIDPSFNSERLLLLDRGFVFGIAHIRGGSYLGRQWYNDGKLLKKKNSFEDFIAAAKHLINEKYTSPDHLAIMGASAGGLLMGAVANMAPDLFRAIIADVPFVDVVNTILDPSLPLTLIEYDEWGNPNEKVFFDYILSYSPYDNVQEKEYPAMLVTAGLNDPRVSYWEPAKWVSKLRYLKKDNRLLLLKTNMTQGHGGASGRYDNLKQVAFKFAFIMYQLGVPF